MAVLDVNTDNLVRYANWLEKLNKKDLPKVVAKTLSKTAMNVKKKTLPVSFGSSMIKRNKSFITSHTRVEFAKAKENVNSIKSTVGFFPSGKQGNSGQWAVKNMLQQEEGGTIKRKEFIPLTREKGGPGKGARTAGSLRKRVTKRNRLSGIRYIKAKDVQGRNEKSKFFNAIRKAKSGGYVLSEKGILWRVKSLTGRKPSLEALFSYEKGRTANIKKPKGFMKKASIRSSRRMNSIFIKEATKQIDFRL